MAKICIIAVAFDRPKSLERLLASLLRANYSGDDVDLLVSIDGGDRSAGTLAAIGELTWPHGECTVRRLPENLGLRRHILHCADTVQNYDAVILLEDDIVVGPDFYSYARWACSHYGDDERVAGISLYAPTFNEMANLPFLAAPSRHSVYNLQSAQSWGQCWTRAMWTQFRDWYATQGESLAWAPDMPDRIYSWPDSSWKKFAMKYLVETGKTWIYPYISHSTNCSEVGTHNRQDTSLFQVALAAGEANLVAAPLDDLVQYDIFFERVGVQLPGEASQDGDRPIILDLYGTRQTIEGPVRLVTARSLPRKAMASFGFHFKPHEINVELDTSGTTLSLYEIEAGEVLDLRKYPVERAVRYYSGMDWRDSLKAGWKGFYDALSRRLSR